MVRLATLCFIWSGADAHGMMSTPPTRNSKGRPFTKPYYASCPGYGCLWFSQGCTIGCSKCTGTSVFNVSLCGSEKKATITDPKLLTWNFDVEPLGPDDWTQFSPWRAPGSAPVYDSCGMAGGGQVPGDPGNGGVPPPGHKVGDLGSDLAELSSGPTVWKPGATVEVAWAIDANHGGGYQYRLCPKKDSPTEECFFKIPLAFAGDTHTIRFLNGTSVDIPAIYVSEGTLPAGSMWARNPIPACGDTDEGGAQLAPCTFPRFAPPLGSSSWGPESYGLWGFGAGACESQLPGKRCTSEQEDQVSLKFEIVDHVQLPLDLPEGDYHLGFRWDVEQTPQVWSSCADVRVTSAPAPPPAPTTPISTSNIKDAVTLWTTDPDSAQLMYGHISAWDTSKVTSLANLFKGNLLTDKGRLNFKDDISNWDTSSVTAMTHMFDGGKFAGDLSKWDVSNVMDFSYMFNGASKFTGDLSKWDVSSATTLACMFKGAALFDADISAWDVSGVLDFAYLFAGTPFNHDIGGWDVSSAIDMWHMFDGAKAFNQDLNAWEVSKVRKMDHMFANAYAFNGDISSWKIASANLDGMFNTAIAFNGAIGNWDTSGVTNMQFMFHHAQSFHGDLSKWDTSSVTCMDNMFSETPFNGDIRSWDVSSVEVIHWMFQKATAFNQDLSKWQLTSVNKLEWMFQGATSFDQDLGWKINPKANHDHVFEKTACEANECGVTYDMPFVSYESFV